MNLDFSGDDFRNANYNNLSFVGVINLATEAHFKPVGRGAAIKWCQENAERARNFCMKVIS